MKAKKKPAKPTKSASKNVTAPIALVLTRGQRAAATRAANKAAKAHSADGAYGTHDDPRDRTGSVAPVEQMPASQSVATPPATPEVPVAPSSAATEVKQLEERDALAQELLGPEAVVWTATHDHKGNAFPAPLFRVGVTTDKPNSYTVEDGKEMIGVGRTFAEAFRAAKKRTEAAALKA